MGRCWIVFFSTQDISFEASGCALRVQGVMSSVPRHLEALWNKEDTKNTPHDGGFRFRCSNWNISYNCFSPKERKEAWNDHGGFIFESWKISWKDFYLVQVNRTWFVFWFGHKQIYVTLRKYSNVLHISELIWSLEIYVCHILSWQEHV